MWVRQWRVDIYSLCVGVPIAWAGQWSRSGLCVGVLLSVGGQWSRVGVSV